MNWTGGNMNLRDYLHFKRMSAKDFAKKIGYHHNYILGVSNGRYIPSERCARVIEEATGGEVTVKELRKSLTES